ncbi:MAG: transcriptional initiation protein Tat [Myxococcales bacterium]|nr:transcriptional initiation protein Tat [Myxococcales bacterium]
MSRWRLSRRAFLGGAGAAIALPFLEAMLPTRALADAAEVPRRFLAFYVPNGIHMPAWTPNEAGRDFGLTPILEPLANVRDHINVISGLANRPARPDGAGVHAAGTSSFLTAAHAFKTEGANISVGVSMDQIAAAAVGGATRFPSLQLGIEGGGNAGGCDSGYSCAYSRNISWASESTPLPKIVSPQLAFDRLFQGFDAQASAAERAKRKRYRTSVLDYARADAQRLKTRLGQTDRRKLDEYMTGVRELEVQVQQAEDGPSCGVPDRPEADFDFPAHVEMMNELMVLAFQCDLTRIITFMLGNAGSGRSYGFLGVPGAHHEISHHQNNPDNFARLQTIDTWEVAQLAYLLERMANTPEGEGSMLDNTLVFFSSEIEDGNSHSHFNLPIVLAGGGGGVIETGRHLVYEEDEPIANLFVSILQNLNVPATSFGDSTGPLAGL